MRNSATSKVIGEGTIQYHSHDRYITTFQGVHHVPDSRLISSLLEPYKEKGSVSVLKVILRKSPKSPM